ncbi:hypothetical protein LSH36_233g04020 [Paralvinella palmiformis]|uniref:DNA polymerase n=1 Tax=Paralvinella palmiformis TaxID=53620 RepID=A0AAD9JMA8_9ANNE|nr:hypothetical protein LSH36_233g04020 [Paralvinella palmiformis]
MDGADISLARSRSRRTKLDKKGRFAALEKLKKVKETGHAHKYEVKEEYVYEEVNEEEYSKIVRKRQEDDWIVDDDGSGYVEDGREIFDEDEDRDGPLPDKGKPGGREKNKKNANIRAPGSQPKSIRSMFAAAAVKPKKKQERDVNLSEDNLLGDIMAELNQAPSTSLMPPPVKLKKKKVAHNPFSVKSSPAKPPPMSKPLTPYKIKQEPILDSRPTAAPSKSKKVKGLKKPTVKVEVGDSDIEAIEEFVSQDNGDFHESQKIEEDDSDAETSAMDISGIDFDDDMDDAAAKEKLENERAAKEKEAAEIAKLIDDVPGASWETIRGDTPEVHGEVQVDSSQLPLTTNEEGEKVVRMYWLDAYEDHYKQPGIVYLFGKVWIESAKTNVSCCVTVKNIERRIFLLPRSKRINLKSGYETEEPVSFVDVYKEFNEVVAEKYKLMKFKSLKVVKDYAFELVDVPAQSEYLEVRYSAEYPQLPSDLKGETFSRVFGTNTSSLELFLLGRKLKGPSWIDIKMPQISNPAVSWCKIEAFVNKPDYIQVVKADIPPPPLVLMALNLRTVPNPKTHQNEIITVSCLIHHQYHMDKPAPKPHFEQHFCTITKPSDCVFPFDFKENVSKQSKSMKIDVMGSERAMLGFLLAKIHKVDPDLIVGHDIFGFDIDVLIHRITQNKVPHWSRLGRLKRAMPPKMHVYGGAKASMSANVTCGRLVCDVKISSKELIRCRSYDLTELISHVLHEKRHEVDPEQIPVIYNNSSHILRLIEWTLMDTTYILRLMYELNVIPLALQITNICGNIMARTLMGGRAERNEYLLLHAFTEKNFVVPDKSYGKKQLQPINDLDEDADQSVLPSGKKNGRRKPAYAGGLVLEPKRGFYDKFILLLDFNSLYPSIIQEYNICFTTITRTPTNTQEDDANEELNLELPDPDLEPGILPTEIRKLVQSRRQVKQLMKAPDLAPETYMQYDIRQKALKLTANSMYGCLGFTFSRFFAKPLAALVTGKGREILLKTKDLVQNMNLDVIYGDTDSIMINTNCTDIEQVFKLGNKVKNEVNKLYRLLEIDIDGVFKTMLLLKKKKYAAVSITKIGDKLVETQELKGLDIVRRDWCELAKEAGNFVVSQILSGETREIILDNIHTKLTEVGQKVKQGDIAIELYHITKSLTKNPEDYPDKKSQPHVQVALRLNSKGGKKIRGGDTVYYVICQDGTNQPPSQRAYHPDEVNKRDDLKIDTTYYLSQQVHPVVARLCDPIDGTDAAHIAECLGLDPTGYRQGIHQQDGDEEQAMLGGGQESDEDKFKDCDRLTFSCPNCGKQIIMDNVFTGTGKLVECTLAKCPNPECKTSPGNVLGYLKNNLTREMRAHIRKYYEGWLCCEDSACSTRTRKLPLLFSRGHPVCGTCHKGILHTEYTDSSLYNQLCFYLFIFDVDRALNNIKDPVEKDCARKCSKQYIEHYSNLKTHVEHVIKQSAYSEVNLGRLFQDPGNLSAAGNWVSARRRPRSRAERAPPSGRLSAPCQQSRSEEIALIHKSLESFGSEAGQLKTFLLDH